MNPTETKIFSESETDASCLLPLLALFGGAALWLVVGLLLALVASIKFHAPDFLGGCPMLTYGRVLPAANDALLYGFCIPAALGVLLWIFARLSESELILPLVPFVAANIWHLGVFIGLVAILIGDSTGFNWLEFPRGSSVLLFTAFLLIAVSAVATFGARRERELYPSHWFLLAALVWFPWIYSTANLFLVAWPVRGVVQSIIDWWFADNLLFVWFSLVGLGTAFYFLPKFSGRPLQSSYYAQFAFWTLMIFGTWCGIPSGAPVPAWLPVTSSFASTLLLVPLLAIIIIVVKTVCGSKTVSLGGPSCYLKFGTVLFIMSAFMVIASGCPQISRVTQFTWFVPAQAQLQIFGFLAMILFGAIYHLLPRIMGFEFPFPKFVRAHFWISIFGILLFIVPLAVGGIEQGLKLNHPEIGIAGVTAATLPFLRISTTGQLLLLLGSLLFAANIFVMTFKWKMALLKTAFAAVVAPLETSEVKS
jgi:cytochrome c oxidase cbb3-type subunit 1